MSVDMQMTVQHLKEFKNEMGWTWGTLADKIGMQERTVYCYLNGRFEIPKHVCLLVRAYRIMYRKGLKEYV